MSGALPPVIRRLSCRLYGAPIFRNVLRGELVEQHVLDALGGGWRAAGDYEAWDIESADETIRIQVKNCAARQSWSINGSPPSRPIFSIAPSRAWTTECGRAADAHRHANVYLFAWHPGTDGSADHRIAEQWEFYVAPTRKLPSSASIGLTAVRAAAQRCSGAVSPN